MEELLDKIAIAFIIFFAILFSCANNEIEAQNIEPLRRTVDLKIGETAKVELNDGTKVELRLLDMGETIYSPTQAVVKAWVTVSINGQEIVLQSGNYHLPVIVDNIQVDCPITRSYYLNTNRDAWKLEKDARLRLWPAGSPRLRPGTFVYPVKQEWFASKTQMCNEMVYVDGGSYPNTKIYYHNGLDFGGAEGMDEVVSATDGLVISAGDSILPGYERGPAHKRYDVIYIQDDRGWIYRYSHLWAFHLAIKPGVRVKMGQKIGVLGKEGGSGGWSHLHFDITSKQPSGEWGTEEGYAYIWEAYVRQYKPAVIAVARPHQFAHAGEKVVLDGSKSWSASGNIERFEWQLSNDKKVVGVECEISYNRPGHYSEILKITDKHGNIDYDFASVTVIDTTKSPAYQIPPTIHASYYPTFNITVDEPVTFFVRSFDTEKGEEVIDYGDGSEPVTVHSNTGYNDNVLDYLGLDNTLLRDDHCLEGYAQAVHRFKKPGHYIIKVTHTANTGYTATAFLHVTVPDEIGVRN